MPAQTSAMPGDLDQAELVNDFRQSMRRFASTVCIITADSPDGPIGMTMTAVTSVSMDPPTLLICVNRNTRLSGALRVGGVFCVNVLRADHENEAAAFGGKLSAQDRFAIGRWQFKEASPPHLEDAQANIFCCVESLSDVGTHFVLFGRVKSLMMHGEVAPLLYTDGRYASLGAGSVGF